MNDYEVAIRYVFEKYGVKIYELKAKLLLSQFANDCLVVEVNGIQITRVYNIQLTRRLLYKDCVRILQTYVSRLNERVKE